MTTDQAINAIRAIQLNALRAAGNVGLAQVIPFVPIDTGDLRASGTVKDDGKDVYIVFGGKDSPGRPGKSNPSVYVENQYSTAERHYDTGGGVLGRLLQLFTGAPKRAAQGNVNRKRYASAYYHVKEQLTRFLGGVRWFKRILNSSDIQRKMARNYANALKAAVRG
jgi:hypothetical protein